MITQLITWLNYLLLIKGIFVFFSKVNLRGIILSFFFFKWTNLWFHKCPCISDNRRKNMDLSGSRTRHYHWIWILKKLNNNKMKLNIFQKFNLSWTLLGYTKGVRSPKLFPNTFYSSQPIPSPSSLYVHFSKNQSSGDRWCWRGLTELTHRGGVCSRSDRI